MLQIILNLILPTYSITLQRRCIPGCLNNPYSAGIDLTARGSESDVYRRQILTTRVDHRTVRENILLLAVYPYHRYSNESERANQDIYDYKLRKTLCVFTNYFSALRVKGTFTLYTLYTNTNTTSEYGNENKYGKLRKEYVALKQYFSIFKLFFNFLKLMRFLNYFNNKNE